MKKIIFLTFIPSPYRVDFFNELSKSCDLHVIYYDDQSFNFGWKDSKIKHEYKKTVLSDRWFLSGIYILAKLLLKNRKNIIIIGGYAMFPEIFSIFFLKLLNIKFVLNSDGGFITSGKFKTWFKKVLIKSATFWLSSGKNTTKTLEYYGAKNNNIYEYYFTSLFEKEILKKLPNNDEKKLLKIKKQLNPEKSYIVFVGQLIHRKGLDILIKAFAKTNLTYVEVLIIGDGELKEMLIKLCKTENISSRVKFLGKKSKFDVLDYLKLSDVFVLPSREDIWGLVVNEAVSCGLAIISTKEVGASHSLIIDNLNGYMINANNTDELTETINKTYNKDLILQQRKSLNISKAYTIENMVKSHLKLFKRYNANSRN